ncbi:MAG: response regulator, partial [Chrysiogenales bacterium]
EMDRGTSIIIYLPVLREFSSFDDAHKPDLIKRGSGLVLVVDDEMMIRTIARDILQQCGYDVMMAADGEEALNIFRDRRDEINLVLLDMAMPRKNGIETYEEMKLIKGDVAVLLSSGFQLDDKVQTALDLGIKGFIQKPYTMDGLSNAVYDILYK